jgi:hypothetical protein
MPLRATFRTVLLAAAAVLSATAARAERWVFDSAIYIPAGEHRLIVVDEILFTSRATIFLQGSLTLAARKISAQPGAAILTSPGPKAGTGTPDGLAGASGGALMLYVSDELIGALRIDLAGQEGGNGAAGRPGQAGAPGIPAQSFQLPLPPGQYLCLFMGVPGQPGSPGQNGGNGGNGGEGGHLTAWLGKAVSASDGLRITDPHGGSAGVGGQGGPGGVGGAATAATPGCGSPRIAGSPGPAGRNGAAGSPGKQGELKKQILAPGDVLKRMAAL